MFLLPLLLVACRDDDELPDEPVINEISYDMASDDLKVRFTDGDGDFGLTDDMIDPPFQALNKDSTSNFFHYNLHVEPFIKQGGEFIPASTNPLALGYRYRIPDLTPQGQNKQLRVLVTVDFSEGIKEVRSLFAPDSASAATHTDTIQFKVTLVDRALNVSQPAYTQPKVFGPS